MYRSLGALGWEPSEVDAMDVWVAASFLGLAPPDDDRTFDPVIRGDRSLVLPKDKDDGTPQRVVEAAEDHVLSVAPEERRRRLADLPPLDPSTLPGRDGG